MKRQRLFPSPKLLFCVTLHHAREGVRGAAGPWHASADLSKPTWGAGVGPLSPELLEEQFVLRGLLPGQKESDRHRTQPWSLLQLLPVVRCSPAEGVNSLAPPSPLPSSPRGYLPPYATDVPWIQRKTKFKE